VVLSPRVTEEKLPAPRKSGRQKAVERATPSIQHWFDKAEYAHIPKQAPEIVEQICDMMVEGDVSLSKICRDKLVPGVPSLSRVMFWRKCDPRIHDALRAAREAQAEAKLDEVEDWIREQFHNEDGEFIDAVEAKARSAYVRSVIDVRKFAAAKLVRRIYGDESLPSRTEFDKAMAEGKVIQVVMPEMKEPVKPPEQKSEEPKALPPQVTFEPRHE